MTLLLRLGSPLFNVYFTHFQVLYRSKKLGLVHSIAFTTTTPFIVYCYCIPVVVIPLCINFLGLLGCIDS